MKADRDQPEGCKLTAHNTGDGWLLAVEAHDNVVAYLEYPGSWPDTMNEATLKMYGFEIV